MVANKEDVQKSLDWVQDLYNTLCSGMHEDESKGEDGSEMHDGTMPADGAMPADGTMPTDGTKVDANGEMADPAMPAADEKTPDEKTTEWDENNDSSDEWMKLMKLHRGMCDTIRQTHAEVSEWNNADAEGKQAIEDKYGEDLKQFFEEWFEGAMGSFAVAGTALAASVAVLAF